MFDKKIILSLTADNANVTQPPAASLSPFSVSQFIDALRHQLKDRVNDEIEEVVLGDFLLGIKKFSVARGQTLGAGMGMTTAAKADQHATSPKSPYLLRGAAEIVLVVDCEADIDDEERENDILENVLTTTIHQMKFLGGHIVDLRVAVWDDTDFHEKALEGLVHQKRLYFYRLRDDLLQKYLDETGNPVRALIEATRPVFQENSIVNGDKKRRWFRREKGFLFLSTIGYQLLEQPKNRRNARFSYPHAFAEPIFSLIELVSARKALAEKQSGNDVEIYWWRKSFDEKSLSYFVSQQ